MTMSKKLIIQVNEQQGYEILYQKEFTSLTDAISKIGMTHKKACIITDDLVYREYADDVKHALEQAENEVCIFTFKNGEEQKNLDTVRQIYEKLITEKFSRTDFLVALGGGVTGDITGFAAATYLRGIEFIQIPTTLLAQVDSSIGGKTGVDFEQYKNMVGAFKMPALVYMNLKTLDTLSQRQFFNGFSEVMKSALLADSDFYEWLIENMYEIEERQPDIIEEMILQSCKIKKKIVENDAYEHGERALLNLGHTIGHAIEKEQNFKLLHGECVSLGCVAAAYISWKKDLIEMEEYYEIRDMFVPFHLPISLENISADQILSLTKSDKKRKNGSLQFVLLKGIGKAILCNDVTDEEIINAIKEIEYHETNE